MWLDRAVKLLLPREDHFFELLERGADCALAASVLMVDLCKDQNLAERQAVVAKLRDAEHGADRVILEVYEALNRTFVTPLDRSDIYALATSTETIVDRMFSTAIQIEVHAMEDVPEGSKALVELSNTACRHIQDGVKLLRTPKRLAEIRSHCDHVHGCEHDGDMIFRARIGEMFKTETDAIRLLKHKEFLEGLEHVLDVCDDMANALENVVIKNA